MFFRSFITSLIIATAYFCIFFKDNSLIGFLKLWSLGFLSILGFVYGRKLKRDLKTETGTIKWFDPGKGYGFLVRDRGGDLFVHLRSIKQEDRRKIKDNTRVRFSVEDSEKGPQAVKIKII